MRRCAFFLAFATLATMPVAEAQAPRVQTSPPPVQRPAERSEAAAAPSVEQDVPYSTAGGHPLMLDIYEPREITSDLRPAVVLLHGGGWTSHDKTSMRGEGTFLAQFGFVAFAVDYRLMHDSENLWPAQLDDVQRAVRWIRAHAAQYGVDRDRIGALGYSAGGQLAALLGTEDTRDNSDPTLAKYSSRVQAVVDMSGPSDFTTNRDADGDAFLTAFFGGDYGHRPEIWRNASPVFHISKKTAPFLIIHGTRDANVPIAQAQELADKLKQARVPVEFLKLDEGHDFEAPESVKRITHETRNFFAQYLRLGH